jgi:hypothetical protein
MIIVALSTTAARPVKQATGTIPIVAIGIGYEIASSHCFLRATDGANSDLQRGRSNQEIAIGEIGRRIRNS